MKAIQTKISSSSNDQINLPLFKLLPLTLAGFVAIMTETMPAGLLLQISLKLGIKESLAGQLITIHAVGSLLAAIPVITATLHWNRKTLLLLAVGGSIVFNALTAFSTNYMVTLSARFLAGVGSGIIWSLSVGYTKQIVTPQQEGKALALVGIGQPIALATGVPAATWLGQSFGLAGTFGLMSLLSLVLGIWVMLYLPGVKGFKNGKESNLNSVLRSDGIKHILFITLIWIIAHNILYTYIAPFLAAFGMSKQVDLLLFVFGISSLIGIVVIGILIDKWLKILITISLLIFAISAVVLAMAAITTWLVYAGICLWGISLGGIATLLQKSLADYAGKNADVAQSMLVTVFNLAIAIGGALGGILLDRQGASSFPWAILILTAIILFSLLKRQKHSGA